MSHITPEQEAVITTILSSGALAATATTARIITRKLPFKTAMGTLILGVSVGVCVGSILSDTSLPHWVVNASVAIFSMTGKELTEFIIRIMERAESKSADVADKLIDKLGGGDDHDHE